MITAVPIVQIITSDGLLLSYNFIDLSQLNTVITKAPLPTIDLLPIGDYETQVHSEGTAKRDGICLDAAIQRPVTIERNRHPTTGSDAVPFCTQVGTDSIAGRENQRSEGDSGKVGPGVRLMTPVLDTRYSKNELFECKNEPQGVA